AREIEDAQAEQVIDAAEREKQERVGQEPDLATGFDHGLDLRFRGRSLLERLANLLALLQLFGFLFGGRRHLSPPSTPPQLRRAYSNSRAWRGQHALAFLTKQVSRKDAKARRKQLGFSSRLCVFA